MNHQVFDHQGKFERVEENGVTVGALGKHTQYTSSDFDRQVSGDKRAALVAVRDRNRLMRWFGAYSGPMLRVFPVLKGPLRIRHTAPARFFESPFSLRTHYDKGTANVEITDQDTESSGSITLQLTVPAGETALVPGILFEFDQQFDEGVTRRGTIQVTYAPYSKNSQSVTETFVADGAGATVFDSVPTTNVMTAKFDMPVGFSEAVLHLFNKPMGAGALPDTIPEFALVRTPKAGSGAEVDALTIDIVITCASGGKLGVTATALTRGSEEYAGVYADFPT